MGVPAHGPGRGSSPLRILFRDAHILVLDKPSGMAMHRGTGHEEGTILDEARRLVTGPPRGPFPVHRLDLTTSGAVILAVTSEAAAHLSRQFEEGQVGKRYLALVKGRAHDKGQVKIPLWKRRADPGKAPRQDLRPALTRYRTLLRGRGVSLLEAVPVTGLPHQIRRHFRHIGHPIAGDDRWGDRLFNTWLAKEKGLSRCFLHCTSLSIRHPFTGEPLTFSSPLPEELEGVLLSLNLQEGTENSHDEGRKLPTHPSGKEP